MPKSKDLTTWDALKVLYKPTDKIGVVFFSAKDQVHKPDPQAKQKIVTASLAWSPEFQKFIRTQNARGYNVSVAANPLVPDATTRTKANVAEIRYLYLDLDSKNGTTGTQQLQSLMADPKCPAPRIVLNTSTDNYQVIWQVQGYTKDAAEDTLRRLAATYGGDLAIGGDISRALRIPGLRNKKYAQHNPAEAAPTTTSEAERTALHGPTITGTIHSDKVHSPDQFAYLPTIQLGGLTPKPQSLELGDNVAAQSVYSLPSGFDATTRTTYQGTAKQQPATVSASDTSASGQDWGHANSLYAQGLRAGKSLADITPEVRSALEASAQARGRADHVRYAEVTIKKLLPTWELRQHQYSRASPAVPEGRSTERNPSPASSYSSTAPIPAPGMQLIQLPAGFDRTPQHQAQDATYILQSLRDGQTPAQIRDSLLDWHFHGVPNASDYVAIALRLAQAQLETERLITTAVDYAQAHGRGHDHELGLFRTLIHQHPHGEGTLANVVTCLSKADDFLPPSPQRVLPTEDHSAYVTAVHIASLALAHGDTPRSVEHALNTRYYPELPVGSLCPDIATIVHQAMLQQPNGLSNQPQELPR